VERRLTGAVDRRDDGRMQRPELLLTARPEIDLARCASARCPR
jgi:hypothetical protein